MAEPKRFRVVRGPTDLGSILTGDAQDRAKSPRPPTAYERSLSDGAQLEHDREALLEWLRLTGRRWQQAFEAYDAGDEAEAFQTVGVRLRECLVSIHRRAVWN